MWRSPVPGVALLAAAPAIYAAARGHHDLWFPVTHSSILGAACLGLAVDDPAESTLTPCPIPSASRRLVRAGLISIIIGVSWVAVALSVFLADYQIGSIRSRVPETVAAAMISIAFASRAARAGSDSPGLAAVTGTLMTLVTSSGLAIYLTWLPQVANPRHTSRWWLIAFVASLSGWYWSRDPSARAPRVVIRHLIGERS